MTEIILYKPGAYCHLKLDNGERVLISITRTGIKITKLGFGGLIPTKTIADWSSSQIAAAMQIFTDDSNPSQQPLDAIKNKIMACASIREVEQLCMGRGPV